MARRPTALIIDDDDVAVMLTARILERAGFAEPVRAAGDADAALSMLTEGRATPDLIVLDIDLPGMTGFEFLDVYEKLDGQPDPNAVAMVTASMQDSDRAEAEADERIVRFVEKPLTHGVAVELANLLRAR